MSPLLVFIVIVAYFSVLIGISFLTSRQATSATFFNANKQSPWYLVAFGMIGTSLSGVTFISVPGEVGNSAFTYYQMVMGYLPGYWFIAFVLLPLYYRLKLVSIYSYLDKRFGFWAYKTGAFFFLLSRTVGAAFRLFLVAGVLQLAFFDAVGIPFWLTVLITLLLIWVYTHRAGIKTIVWTDSLQTFFMLLAVALTIGIVAYEMDFSFSGLFSQIQNEPRARIFEWDWQSPRHFVKQFMAGAFMAIVMTGLDQDMMQKNLTCRNLKDARKNMLWFSLSLLVVNLLFLVLGTLLYLYVDNQGLFFTHTSSFHYDAASATYQHTDMLYPILALQHFNTLTGIAFLLGIVAAAFSSADSALTALTTSFCIDFLKFDPNKSENSTRTRLLVHLAFSFLVFLVIIIFRLINDDSVVNQVFRFASYTYGPLLGLYAFGLFTRWQIHDRGVPVVAIISPLLSYGLTIISEDYLGGYKFGFELLIINGAITFLGLLLLMAVRRYKSMPSQ